MCLARKLKLVRLKGTLLQPCQLASLTSMSHGMDPRQKLVAKCKKIAARDAPSIRDGVRWRTKMHTSQYDKRTWYMTKLANQNPSLYNMSIRPNATLEPTSGQRQLMVKLFSPQHGQRH